MENTILKNEEQKIIEEDYKQIYPNDSNIVVKMKSNETDYQWISNGIIAPQLGFLESFKYKDSLFLSVDKDFPGTIVTLTQPKNSQTQFYDLTKIYLVIDDEKFRLDDNYAQDFHTISKKIDKIYFNIKEYSLIVFLNKDFVSKKEEKNLEKKLKEEAAKKEINDLFK